MTQSLSTAPSLHPVLRSALASLDVPLDTELALYRRHRSQQATALVHQPQGEETASDLPALPASEGAIAPLSTTEATASLPEGAVQTAASDALSADAAPGASEVAAQQPDQISPSPKTAKTFDHYLDPSIEDYLESSEALLQHLEDSDAAVPPPPPQPPSNPVRVWSLVAVVALMMLGCVGFVIATTTGLFKRPPAKSPQSAQVTTTPKTAVADADRPAPSPSATSVTPKGPDLSSKEFVELNLSNLGQVDPQTRPEPTPAPGATAPSVALPSVAPSPPAAGSTPAPASPPAGTRSFYIVTTYTGDASLAQAKQVVPNAYVATFADGQRIQLGTLYDFEKAKEMAQGLREKGLDASILASN